MATLIALIIAVIIFFMLLPVFGRGAIERLVMVLIIVTILFMVSRYILETYVF